MKPSKEPKGRSRHSSPLKDRTTAPSPRFERRSSSPPKPRASALLKRDLVITDVTATARFEEELATSSSFNNNPRSFPYTVKQQCWDKAEKIKGRDPDRWRRDPLGNTIFRKLVGCPGCLCHDYDHIVPYSKGGQSALENCQILQATVNRSKGNRTEFSRVLTVWFQVVTWIFSNCQPMAMSVGDKIQGDVESNDNLRRCVTSCRIHPSIEGETGN